MRAFFFLLLWSGIALGAGDLREAFDLTRVDENGTPERYAASIHDGSGPPLNADGRISPDDEEGVVRLELPNEGDLWLDLKKPVELEPEQAYQFEVKLRWDELSPTGAGMESFGPCFVVYVHGQPSHRLAVVKPSGRADGWVTVRIAFDTRQYPDLQKMRIFFRSKGVSGNVWVKDAVLEPVEMLPSPTTSFVLPGGEVVASPVLSL